MTLSECHLQTSPRGWHQDCSKLGRWADEKLESDYETNVKAQKKSASNMCKRKKEKKINYNLERGWTNTDDYLHSDW